MTLEKNASGYPKHTGNYQLDTTTQPKYEDADRSGPWLKMAAEMPLMSSYIFSDVDEADALVKAIHECGFKAKTESGSKMEGDFSPGIFTVRVFKLDKEK